MEEEEIPHNSYKDDYIIQKRTDGEIGEESERIYLFKCIENKVELSETSDIINAIRNKKIFVRRLHYPQEIEDVIQKFFKN